MSGDDSEIRDPRISNLDVVQVFNEKTGKFDASYFENFSRSGLFIITNDPRPAGSELRLKFTLVTHHKEDDAVELRPVDVRGEVMHMIKEKDSGLGINPGMGIRFLDLPDDVQNIIDEIVTSGLEPTPS